MRITKIVRNLGSTETTDDISVSVLKQSANVLACPIAHLVNRSLASGTVPTVFKNVITQPVYKVGGKSRSDPPSYIG